MKYFTNIETIADLKKEYRKLIKANHPDNGGDTWVMAEINNEYEKLFNLLKEGHNAKAAQDTTGHIKPMTETPEMFREIIEKIINLDGIEIELCGSWIWVSGNTYPHKKTLLSAGLRWASKKKVWYWRCEADAYTKYHKPSTMDHIREKFGSDRITKPTTLNLENNQHDKKA